MKIKKVVTLLPLVGFILGMTGLYALAHQVELKIWTFYVDQKGTYEPIFSAFEEKYPDIKIVPSWYEATPYKTTLKSAFAVGKGPDIFATTSGGHMMAMIKGGQAQPLTPWMTKEWKESCYDSALHIVEGKIYCVSTQVPVMSLYYNKDIFREYGLTVPKVLDDMYEMAEKLVVRRIFPLSYGSGGVWNADKLWFHLAGQTAGDEVIRAADKGLIPWDIPPFVTVMKMMVEMREKGCFPRGFQGMSWQDVKTVFYQRKAAMWLFGDWQIQIFKDENVLKTESNPEGIDVGVALFPAIDKYHHPVEAGGAVGGLMINRNSAHKEEAAKFIKFLTFGQGKILIARTYKIPSGPYDPEKVEPYWEEPYKSLAKHFVNNMDSLVGWGNLILTPEVANELTVQIQGVNNGMTSPEEAMKKVQEAFEKAKAQE